MEEIKKQRIWKPLFDLMYYLGITRNEFMRMGRKEMRFHFEQLQERLNAHSKAGTPGKDIVSANDPMVQSMLPNPTGRPRTNPRNNRPF